MLNGMPPTLETRLPRSVWNYCGLYSPGRDAETPPLDYSPSTAPSSLVSEDEELNVFAAFRPMKKERRGQDAKYAGSSMWPDLRGYSALPQPSLLRADGRISPYPTQPEVENFVAVGHYPVYQKDSSSREPRMALAPTPLPRQFNPHAAAFTPSQRNATSPPAQMDSPRQPIYFQALEEGAMSADASVHDARAASIVLSQTWTQAELVNLARHFCWAGSVAGAAGRTAQFAAVVAHAFHLVNAEQCASEFLYHLEQCMSYSFQAVWDTNRPSPENVTLNPTSEYLCTAISMAAFIGELSALDLVPDKLAHHCLHVLLNNLSTIEHVEAVGELVARAGEKLWHGGQPIEECVVAFTQRTSVLGITSSLRRRRLDISDVQKAVKMVVDMLHSFRPAARLHAPATVAPRTRLEFQVQSQLEDDLLTP